MDGGVLGYSMADGSSGEQKRRGETPTGFAVISSTASCLSIRQSQEQVERFYSCTRHLTCSALGPSDQACECRNAG